MHIDSSYKNGYQILKITKDSNSNLDLSILKIIVQELLEKGIVNIALSFSEDFHIQSKPVGVLVTCNEMIKAYNGTLAIIQPNEYVSEVLKLMDLYSQIKIYPSEDDMST